MRYFALCLVLVACTSEKGRGVPEAETPQWVLWQVERKVGPFGPPAPWEPIDGFPTRDACRAESLRLSAQREPQPSDTLRALRAHVEFFCVPKGVAPRDGSFTSPAS